MEVVVGTNHPDLLAWTQQHVETGAVFTPETTRCVALLDGLSPLAVVAFDGWTERHVEATIASDGTRRWATRRFISAIYRYAFEDCERQRINMVTEVSNDAANRMHAALGHVLEGRFRDWIGPGRDVFFWGYTRDDWLSGRWHRLSQSSKYP